MDKKELMNIELVKTKIEPTKRKMNFCSIRVCSTCGDALMSPNIEDNLCHDGKTETLKEYYERTEKKPFKEEDWSFECEDINMCGVDAVDELTNCIIDELK